MIGATSMTEYLEMIHWSLAELTAWALLLAACAFLIVVSIGRVCMQLPSRCLVAGQPHVRTIGKWV